MHAIEKWKDSMYYVTVVQMAESGRFLLWFSYLFFPKNKHVLSSAKETKSCDNSNNKQISANSYS